MSYRIWIGYNPADDKPSKSYSYPWVTFVDYNSVAKDPDSLEAIRFSMAFSSFRAARRYAKKLNKKFTKRESFNHPVLKSKT